MKVKDLRPGHSVFGNKGNVWNNSSHIYKVGVGNLCGTPALSTNWSVLHKVEDIGCKDCLTKYKQDESNLQAG